MHCNKLGLVLGLGLVTVSRRVIALRLGLVLWSGLAQNTPGGELRPISLLAPNNLHSSPNIQTYSRNYEEGQIAICATCTWLYNRPYWDLHKCAIARTLSLLL